MTVDTSLAVREFTDKQIRTRLDVAAGFGWRGATKEQLNGAYLLAIKYDLDPLTDLTLYRDQIIYTIDGRVRIMRRHPQYAGYETRPLSKEEKDAWGYASDEIVVECAIRTKEWGTIKARGKVAPAEFARQPVAKSHPQEMAEKRAIARASRMAFGQDVPDDDEIAEISRVVIAERNDPARVAANAAKYEEVFGDAYADMPETPREAMVDSVRHPAYQELVDLVEAAAAGDIDVAPFRVMLPLPLSDVLEKIGAVQRAIEAKTEMQGAI